MGYFTSNGCTLFFEDQGSGPPLVFLNEFGGDTRSWRQQIAFFARRYRCLALSPRGYPPSDVPENDAAYGWQVNIDDAAALLDHLEIPSAHFIGLSMGAYSGLMLAIQRPGQVQSLVAASGGSGAWAESRDAFIAACHCLADLAVAQAHMPADQMAYGPSRIQLREKNRAAWDEFYAHLAEHPGVGSGLTQRWVQAARPSLVDFAAEFAASNIPVLLMVGDEDDPCLDTNLWLKRTMPCAGLSIWPKAGHLLNLEDPDRFNAECQDFLDLVAAGKWPDRNALLARHRAPDGAIF